MFLFLFAVSPHDKGMPAPGIHLVATAVVPQVGAAVARRKAHRLVHCHGWTVERTTLAQPLEAERALLAGGSLGDLVRAALSQGGAFHVELPPDRNGHPAAALPSLRASTARLLLAHADESLARLAGRAREYERTARLVEQARQAIADAKRATLRGGVRG